MVGRQGQRPWLGAPAALCQSAAPPGLTPSAERHGVAARSYAPAEAALCVRIRVCMCVCVSELTCRKAVRLEFRHECTRQGGQGHLQQCTWHHARWSGGCKGDNCSNARGIMQGDQVGAKVTSAATHVASCKVVKWVQR